MSAHCVLKIDLLKAERFKIIQLFLGTKFLFIWEKKSLKDISGVILGVSL